MSGKTKKQKPTMMRGTVVVLRRRCGKPNCRCVDGGPHESWALSYSHKGKTQMLGLRENDLPEVRTALGRYRETLAALEVEALAGIEAMRRNIRLEKKQGKVRR